MKKGDKILIELPIEGKFLEAEFKEYPELRYFSQKHEHVWVIINDEEWLIPKSKIFKRFND